MIKTIEIIEKELINSEWALRKNVLKIKIMFEGIADPYLKSRLEDIMHVASLFVRNLNTQKEETDISKIKKRVILVGKDISPADASKIQLERIKGFITDYGSKTSHTSIVAKNLQIPCVVGLKHASAFIKNEDIIIVDAINGYVIINPEDKTIVEYEELGSSHLIKTSQNCKKKSFACKNKRW